MSDLRDAYDTSVPDGCADKPRQLIGRTFPLGCFVTLARDGVFVRRAFV